MDLCIRTIQRHNPTTRLIGPRDVAAMPESGEVRSITRRLSPAFRSNLLRVWLIWSGGIEEVEQNVLSNLQEGDYLGQAFMKTQKRLYSKEHMQKRFANEINHRPHYFLPENGSREERMAVLMTKLLRGHNLIGNPFLRISYSNKPESQR